VANNYTLETYLPYLRHFVSSSDDHILKNRKKITVVPYTVYNSTTCRLSWLFCRLHLGCWNHTGLNYGTGLDRRLGLREVEVSRSSRQSAHEGGKLSPYAPAVFSPPGDSLVSVRDWVGPRPQGLNQ